MIYTPVLFLLGTDPCCYAGSACTKQSGFVTCLTLVLGGAGQVEAILEKAVRMSTLCQLLTYVIITELLGTVPVHTVNSLQP